MTCDMRYVTCDMGHVTHGGGGKHSPTISAPLLLQFGREGLFEDVEEKGDSVNE